MPRQKKEKYVIDPATIKEFPLAFTTPKDEFVDRMDEISLLLKMIDLVKIRGGANYVVLGRRRIGKSAVIERIFDYLWNTQKDVIPLFFSFVEERESYFLDAFHKMLDAFLKQYMSFTGICKYSDASIMSRDELLELGTNSTDEGLKRAIAHYKVELKDGYDRAIASAIVRMPRTIADTNDSSIVVFIDEFQFIVQMKDKRGNRIDLTPIFQPAVESPRCDFYVTGSAVTMIRERILHEGPLLGRFDVLYIRPLPEYYGLELCDKLASKYGLKLSEKQKSMLVEYCGSHPYYIRCFMRK